MPRNESAGSVKGLLTHDHRRLDAVLAEAKRALSAQDLGSARARFTEFRDGLEHHIEAEEKVLFPAFERLTGASGGGPTQVLRIEHRELRRLMAEVAESLDDGGDQAHLTPWAALTARIYAHNGKEERILYPAADRAARAADTLAELVRDLETF